MRLTGWMLGAVLAGGVAVGAHVANAEEWRMAASPGVWRAQGIVSTDDKGANTELKVQVEGLIPAQQANLGNNAYVVWLQPTNQDLPPQNVGAIEVNDSRRGELKTLTALRNFTVFITPERSAAATEPTGKDLLSVLVSARPHH